MNKNVNEVLAEIRERLHEGENSKGMEDLKASLVLAKGVVERAISEALKPRPNKSVIAVQLGGLTTHIADSLEAIEASEHVKPLLKIGSAIRSSASGLKKSE